MSRTNKKSANRSGNLALERALLGKLVKMPPLPAIPGKKKGGPKPSAQMRQMRMAGQQGRRQGANRQFSAASAYASGQSGMAPVVRASADQCYVKHRELVTNISGTSSAAFVLANTFALNPGIQATFPWLSTMAQNWETYRFRKLRFCYYTRTGSTTVGSVVFCPDYDAADAAPANESLASTFKDVQEDVPWKDIITPLSPIPLDQPQSRKYIRTGALAANLDIKTYDAGNLFVFTVDSAAAAAWGKLWVEYEVDLFTPQSQSSIPVGVAGGSFVKGGSATGANPLGTAPSSNAANAFIAIDGSSDISFQKTGTYLIGYDIAGTVLSAYSATLGTGVTSIASINIANGGATLLEGYDIISVDSLTGATYTPGLTATTLTNSQFVIGSLPAGSG
jgi:hypothetical protein